MRPLQVVGADALVSGRRCRPAVCARRPRAAWSGSVSASTSIAFSRFIALSRLGVLAAFGLRFHHHAAWHVGDADRRFGLLTCHGRRERTEGIDLEVGGIDLDLDVAGLFRDDRHGRGGRMRSAIRSGTRCIAVRAGFELQTRVRAAAFRCARPLSRAAVFAGIAADVHVDQPWQPGVAAYMRSRSPAKIAVRRRRCPRAFPGTARRRRGARPSAPVARAVRPRVPADANARRKSSSASSANPGSPRIASAGAWSARKSARRRARLRPVPVARTARERAEAPLSATVAGSASSRSSSSRRWPAFRGAGWSQCGLGIGDLGLSEARVGKRSLTPRLHPT